MFCLKSCSPIEALLCIVLSSVSSAFHVTYCLIGLLYHSIFWKKLNFLKVGSIDSTMESAFNEGEIKVHYRKFIEPNLINFKRAIKSLRIRLMYKDTRMVVLFRVFSQMCKHICFA